MLSRTDALRAYAAMMNTLDATDFAPLLADDFCYESQWAFSEIESKKEFVHYISRRLQAMKSSGKRVWAELGHCIWGPCVVIAQDKQDNLVATVVIEVEGEEIQRIDWCCIP